MIYTNYDQTPTPTIKARSYYQEPEKNTEEEQVYVQEVVPPWIRVPSFVDATMLAAGSTLIAGDPPTLNTIPMAINIDRARWIRKMSVGVTGDVERHGVQGYTLVATIGTGSNGVDSDGAAITIAGTEADASQAADNRFRWALAQVQPRWGHYSAVRFKLPTTMTSLANRVFFIIALGSNVLTPADVYAADTGGTATETYIALRWRQDTDSANWQVRCGNGSNDANVLDTGVAVATGTIYNVEFWCTPGTSPVHYVRINGGAAQIFSGSTVPSATADFGGANGGKTSIWGRNTAAVTGNGAIAITAYKHEIFF